MMRLVVAVVAVAVLASASSYTFQQHKLPCAYQLHLKVEQEGKHFYEETYIMNGAFALLKQFYEGETFSSLARPDLSQKKDGKDVLTLFKFSDSECEVALEPFGRFMGELSELEDQLFFGFQNRTWGNKERVKYLEREFDHYYDDASEGIYVDNGYIHLLYTSEQGKTDWFLYDYVWNAPLDSFALSKKDYPKCVEQEGRVADVPSEAFAFCNTV